MNPVILKDHTPFDTWYGEDEINCKMVGSVESKKKSTKEANTADQVIMNLVISNNNNAYNTDCAMCFPQKFLQSYLRL